MASRHVALMRGINVGGRNRLPMKELVDCFEVAGASDVQTYIQSGNVLFTAPARVVEKLADELPSILDDRFGFSVPVVLRTVAAVAEAVEVNPFVSQGADPAHLAIGFLSTRPAPEAVAALDPDRSPGDRFMVIGREVHLHVPGGMARTKLTTPFFDRGLGAVMTVRNWRTVNKLVEMGNSTL